MAKHEWRKKEKQYYLPKQKPEVIEVPEFKFVSLAGEGNPNEPFFTECISVLYAVSYGVKMTAKKMETPPEGHNDYAVYPLEGIWDLNEKAKKRFDGTLNKDDLVFNLMIRQPNFLSEAFFFEILKITKKKKPHELLNNVKFESISDGKCIQMLHIGPYDNEPESFQQMAEYASDQGLTRLSKAHREIYLSDFRKVAPEKLKTVLRFKVK